MHDLSRRWEWTPPSLCTIDFGVGEAALIGSALAEGVGTAGFGGTAAGIASAEALTGAGASVLPSLSTIGTAASLGGTVLSAKAGLDQSAYAESVAKAEAEAQRQKANEDAALGQRVQISRNRQTDLALSRAQALAAAS